MAEEIFFFLRDKPVRSKFVCVNTGKKKSFHGIPFVMLRAAATELTLRPGDLIPARDCLARTLDYIVPHIIINIR